MSVCHAKFCQNSAKCNLRMFRFPRESKRRTIWAQNCGKKEASDTVVICEKHFEESQFEQHRADGWKKLKPNAIPTLFEHTIPSQLEKDNLTYRLVDDNSDKENSKENTNECSSKSTATSWLLLKIHSLKAQLVTERKKIMSLRAQLKEEKELSRRNVKIMKKYKNQYLEIEKNLRKIPIFDYFYDGLRHIRPSWPIESIGVAAQLKNAVGVNTYLYMKRNLKLPLPSIATINRHAKELRTMSDFMEKVRLMLEDKGKKRSRKSNQDESSTDVSTDTD